MTTIYIPVEPYMYDYVSEYVDSLKVEITILHFSETKGSFNVSASCPDDFFGEIDIDFQIDSISYKNEDGEDVEVDIDLSDNKTLECYAIKEARQDLEDEEDYEYG